jgi:hypothetical protein
MPIDLSETEIKYLRMLVIEQAIAPIIGIRSLANLSEDFREILLNKIRCALNEFEETESRFTVN